jgi:hypothetical protein
LLNWLAIHEYLQTMEQEDMLDPILLEERKKQKRPVVITVICILYFCFIALIIPALARNTTTVKSFSFLMVTVYLLTTVICIIGLWKMQKWAVYSFIALTILAQVFTLSTGNWNLTTNIIPTICSVILLFHLKKMNGYGQA